MKEIIFKLVVCAYLAAVLFFSSFSKAADAEKFSCDNYVTQGWCPNPAYIYSSAQAAALPVIKAFIAQQAGYSEITYTLDSCASYYGMEYVLQCVAQLTYYKLDAEGKPSVFLKQPFPILINKQQIEEAVCNDTAEVKGSIGTVIVSGAKKYVLSRSPGENICIIIANMTHRNPWTAI